jgi:protein O-GlcNAc transferase
VEALAAFEKALTLNRDNPLTWINRGDLLNVLDRHEAALADFEAALAIDPRNAEALSGHARAFQDLKHFPEAAVEAENALAIDPENTQALHVAVHCRLHSCDWSHLENDCARVREGLAAGRTAIPPFDWKALSDSEEEHLACTRLWVARQCPPREALWQGEAYRHDKIRIAYISTDLRDHAVAFLIVGVFEHHDKSRFETHAISIGPDDGRETRKRIVTAFDRFIDARNMTNAEVAAYLRRNEIDIAIDLNGFTGDARTKILAMRPAPVQLNYLGYPGTMAAPFIDYIIADRIVIPDENRRFYGENVVYLPDQYQANDSRRRIAERTPTRAEVGLPETGFVFCSFNTNYKITPEIFDIWMRLLKAVDASVLWLLDDNRHSVAALKREAAARGVAPERLVFAPRRHHDEYLAQQRLADLFLDTLPYNAHTTASDALWAGLPVLTCIGAAFPGRVAASLVTAAGLPELVTRRLEDYETLALALARDPVRLGALKAKIAANRGTCALFDTARMTRQLESAYTTMHERQIRGLPPEGFAVPRL